MPICLSCETVIDDFGRCRCPCDPEEPHPTAPGLVSATVATLKLLRCHSAAEAFKGEVWNLTEYSEIIKIAEGYVSASGWMLPSNRSGQTTSCGVSWRAAIDWLSSEADTLLRDGSPTAHNIAVAYEVAALALLAKLNSMETPNVDDTESPKRR